MISTLPHPEGVNCLFKWATGQRVGRGVKASTPDRAPAALRPQSLLRAPALRVRGAGLRDQVALN